VLILGTELQELLPGIIHQLGPDNLQNLKQLAEQYSAGFTAADASHMAHHAVTTEEDEEDDEVPELVENFEEASKK
jgi:nascent polypeptide-associated complex subunit beta